MSSKKKYLYDFEAEKDGELRRFAIYKTGRAYFINDHLVHRSNCTPHGLRAELSLVFGAKFIRIIRDFGGE